MNSCFGNKPKYFTTEDEKNYYLLSMFMCGVINITVKWTEIEKYKKIIAPSAKSEGIFIEVSVEKNDYTLWHNPRELVNRLKPLRYSKIAVRVGHINRKDSIIVKHREAKIME